MHKNILSIDLGYGDNKTIFGNSTEGIKRLFKYPSVAGRVNTSALVNDNRIVSLGDDHYYLGADALSLESNKIIDISSYEQLEKFAPLFIARTISLLGATPDIIATGLSISQIENSGYFREAIKKYLNSLGVTSEIVILPQGAIAKKAVDKYGTSFPTVTQEFNSSMNYVGCDIGFDTLDIFQVINGQTSSALVRGIPNRGIVVIAGRLAVHIKSTMNITLTVKEAKEVLDSGQLTRRGKTHDFREVITGLKRTYLEELNSLIEGEFGQVLDKTSFMFLFGGGSYFFGDMKDEFFRRPEKHAEYYNAVGYFEYVVDSLK